MINNTNRLSVFVKSLFLTTPGPFYLTFYLILSVSPLPFFLPGNLCNVMCRDTDRRLTPCRKRWGGQSACAHLCASLGSALHYPLPEISIVFLLHFLLHKSTTFCFYYFRDVTCNTLAFYHCDNNVLLIGNERSEHLNISHSSSSTSKNVKLLTLVCNRNLSMLFFRHSDK